MIQILALQRLATNQSASEAFPHSGFSLVLCSLTTQ
jgi:hypothetical protein